MTGTPFNLYPAQTDAVAANDTLLSLDVSDQSVSPAGKVKQPTLAQLAAGLGTMHGLVANVVDYGADPSGNTDSTAAIAAAVAAVTPADGVFDAAGTVFIPGGQFITQPIVLPQRVGLAGSGYGSTLVLAASSPANCTMISNSQDAGATGNGAQMCFVSNLRLDGNNSHRSGNWDNAIVFTNTYHPTWPYEYSDARHVITGVNIQYFTGDGIVVDDSVISDCNTWAVGGFGFITASDANFSNCSAGGSGLDGFVVPGSSQLTNCKAWYSGGALTSGQYSGQSATALTVTAPNNYWGSGSLTYSLALGYGNGFLLGQPASGGPTSSGNFGTLSGCYAQDNARAGFYILQSYANLAGCTADSNGNCGTSDGTSTGTPVGSFAGFDVNSAGSNIDGISYNRSANLNQQAAGLHVYSGSTGGSIHLGFGGSLNDGSNMPPLMAGDVPQGIGLTMYHMSTYTGSNQGGGYLTDSSFATGSYTVDPYWATTYDLTLSGDITLGNPALKGTNTTGTFLYQGRKLRFIIRQGSTAYTVSWGTAFNVRVPPSAAPDSVNILDFVYDGTKWQQAVGGDSVIYPSGDGTGATDTAAINAIISNGGACVLAQTGTDWAGAQIPFYINAPLTPATGSSLRGSMPYTASPGDSYGKGGGLSGGSVLYVLPTFSGAAVIDLTNTTATQAYGVSLRDFTIEAGAQTTGHGILIHGAWGAGIIDGVCINFPAADALHFEADGTQAVGPDDWWVRNCKFSGAAAYGVWADNVPDSTFDGVESSDSGLDNWLINFSLNTKLLACKGENSGGGAGFHLGGQGGPGRALSLVNCGTHLNNQDGYLFDNNASGTAGGVYQLVGCYADNDGAAGGTTFAAYRANGCVNTVIATGCSASGAPYGASQTGSSTGMIFTGSSLSGTTANTHDDGSNSLALTVRASAAGQRATLSTAFTTPSSATAQNVTGLAVKLQPGTYKVTGWFPMKQSAGTGTEQFGFTFGGTVTGLWGEWLVTQGTTQTNLLITTITTKTAVTAALSSGALLFAEFRGQITVSAVGTLQFQVTASATGTQVIFPVGSYLDIEPLV